MKNNHITITTELTNQDIDLTQKYLKILPIITYNNNIYKSKLDNNVILINVISAGITNILLNNSQRHININLLKLCFRFSLNVINDLILLAVDSYKFTNDNILVDSREDVILNISAYVNHDNKSYFLNSTSCLINSYEFNSNFSLNNNIILPLENSIKINLNDYILNNINTFPSGLILSYIEADIISNAVISPILYVINLNILTGTFKRIYKDGLYNNYWLTDSTKLKVILLNMKHTYRNVLLNKTYLISNGNLSCYVMAAKPIVDVIWIRNNEILQLFYNYNYRNSVFNNEIKYYGASNFECQNIIRSLSAYVYDLKSSQYILTQPTINSNKFVVNLLCNCANTNISNYNIPIYTYTLTSIYNKDIYFIASENNTIKVEDFIISHTDRGLTDKFYINDNLITEIIPDKNVPKTYIILNWKLNIYGNRVLAGSGQININPLNVYNTYIPEKIYYNLNIVLTGLYTDNLCIYHSLNILYDKDLLNVIATIQKDNLNYYLNLKVKNKKKLLNTILCTITDLIFYKKLMLKLLLSSVAYNVTVYGLLGNFAKKTYTLLTKNNILSGKYLLRRRNHNIIDCCANEIHIEVPEYMAYLSDNIEFPWINHNQFTNIIDGHILTYLQMQEFIKLSKKKSFKYEFININTDLKISYELTNKDLFKFPGIRQYQLYYNNVFINLIDNIEDLYSNTFMLSGNVNKLKIDDNEIKFNTYYLDLPSENNMHILQKTNYINKKIIKLYIWEKISSVSGPSGIYNISGLFINYNANTKSFKVDLSLYGRYDTLLNIYPKDIVYSLNDVFLNFLKYNLTCDITPTDESYLMQLDSISGVYYNITAHKYYAKIQIDKSIFQYALIDINKIFSVTSHIILDKFKTDKETRNINIKNSNIIILNLDIENQLPLRIYIKTNTEITAILDLLSK